MAGRSPKGSGHSAEPEPSCTVSAVPASVPNARQMQMQWHTEAGEVLFYYPSNLSARDVEDVRDLIDLCVKGMERRASAIEAATADKTENTGLAGGESATRQGDAQ